MTPLQQITAALDRGHADALNAIADLHEEAGDIWLARAYRWLADNHKAPCRTDEGVWQWHHSPHKRVVSFLLPEPAYSHMLHEVRLPDPGCNHAESLTLHGAYANAAHGVIQMLQRIEAGLPTSAPSATTSMASPLVRLVACDNCRETFGEWRHDPSLSVCAHCLIRVPPTRRTKRQVLALKRSIHGCCERHAERSGCACETNALPDESTVSCFGCGARMQSGSSMFCHMCRGDQQ